MTHDIERALVGAVMQDGDIFERVREVVKPESFSNHALGNAWRAMDSLYERGAGIDTVTVGDELERTGGRYGLQTMCEGGGMANATIIERLG
mgnify:CR=1 FL=1